MNPIPSGHSDEFSDDQLDTLLDAAARQPRPDTLDIEYGFETRVMAMIREKKEMLLNWSFSLVSFRLAPFLGLAAVALFLVSPGDGTQDDVANNQSSVSPGSSIFDWDENSDGGLWEDWN